MTDVGVDYEVDCGEMAVAAGIWEVDYEELALLKPNPGSVTRAIGDMGLEDFLRPGGSWGGSAAPVWRGIQIGQRNGLTVTSLKRRSGNRGSDHHTSQRLSYAADLSNGTSPTPQMLRTAQQIAAALGYRWPSNGYLSTRTSRRGYRAQLIYNSTVVPKHHNHVHLGVRKVR